MPARRTKPVRPFYWRTRVRQHGTAVPQSHAQAQFPRLRLSGGQDAVRVDQPWRNGCSWTTCHTGECRKYTIIGGRGHSRFVFLRPFALDSKRPISSRMVARQRPKRTSCQLLVEPLTPKPLCQSRNEAIGIGLVVEDVGRDAHAAKTRRDVDALGGQSLDEAG